jgi:hypothetical protein
MSVVASPSDGLKIDIGASVRAAYSIVIENARLAVDLAWLPFAILVAAELVALVLGGGGFIGRALSSLAYGLGFLLFGTIFIVRWHRFILLGERGGEGLFPPGWSLFFLAGLKVALVVLVGIIILGFVAAMPPHFLTFLIAVAGGVALAFAAARVSLIFPAAAIERPIGLHQAWELLAGNYWRLFACLLLCYLPFGIVHYILDQIGLGLPWVLWFVLQVIGLAMSFAGAAVVASLLSDVYRGFYPPEAETERRAS